MFLIFQKCLHIDPDKRPFCADLLQHAFFQMDGFAERYGTIVPASALQAIGAGSEGSLLHSLSVSFVTATLAGRQLSVSCSIHL